MGRLDSADRTTLKLSYRFRIPDEALAEQLGLDEDRVETMRDQALERLAEDLGVPTDAAELALSKLRDPGWRPAESSQPRFGRSEPRFGRRAESAAAVPAAEPDAGTQAPAAKRPVLDKTPADGAATEAPPAAEQAAREVPAGTVPPPADRAREPASEPLASPPRRRLPARLVFAAFGAAAIAGLVILLASGGDDPSDQREPAADGGADAGPPRPDQGPSDAVTIVETAAGRRLTLEAGSLSRGRYQAWLYNSILDARALGRVRRARPLRVVVPAGRIERYRYVDVSRQPVGRGDHSGISVLRVSTGELRPGVSAALAPPGAPRLP